MQMTIDLSNKQAGQFQQLAKSLSIPPQEIVVVDPTAFVQEVKL